MKKIIYSLLLSVSHVRMSTLSTAEHNPINLDNNSIDTWNAVNSDVLSSNLIKLNADSELPDMGEYGSFQANDVVPKKVQKMRLYKLRKLQSDDASDDK